MYECINACMSGNMHGQEHQNVCFLHSAKSRVRWAITVLLLLFFLLFRYWLALLLLSLLSYMFWKTVFKTEYTKPKLPPSSLPCRKFHQNLSIRLGYSAATHTHTHTHNHRDAHTYIHTPSVPSQHIQSKWLNIKTCLQTITSWLPIKYLFFLIYQMCRIVLLLFSAWYLDKNS